MEKQSITKKNKILLIIIIVIALLAFTLFGIFTGVTISAQKKNNDQPSQKEKLPVEAEEENIEEIAIDYITYFDSIRENMTYLPTSNKKIPSSEIQELDILKTTINNLFQGVSSEDGTNSLTFEEIKNYALKTFDIKDFNYYPNELYTWKYYMFAVRYYKFTKENNLYKIAETTKDAIPASAIVSRKLPDETSGLEMVPLKVTQQEDIINVYVAKTNFIQGQGFYNTKNELVCYKIQYNSEQKQYDCILSNNVVENYMNKFEIYKYRYKYENDNYKLISINS